MATKKQTQKKAQSLPGGDQATYVSRPRRKPDSSTKGKLNRWDGTDYIEFIPAGTKESNRQMLRQLGNSSFYKSEGTKESSFSCHLNVDGKVADPVAEMDELYLELTKDQRKQAPMMPEVGQGRMLFDDGQGLQVWLDTEKHEVNIQTRLECGQNIERMLLQAQATMNVTIGRYRQEIINNSKSK